MIWIVRLRTWINLLPLSFFFDGWVELGGFCRWTRVYHIHREYTYIIIYIYYIFAAYTYIYILILCNIMHMLYMYVTRTCTIISTVHYVIYIYTHMVRTYNCDHVYIYIFPYNIDKSKNLASDSGSSRTYDQSWVPHRNPHFGWFDRAPWRFFFFWPGIATAFRWGQWGRWRPRFAHLIGAAVHFLMTGTLSSNFCGLNIETCR
jgi:hypothetical protein